MIKREKNPFVDDSIVGGEDYCSRKNIEEDIFKKINSGHNLALIGDRRIGKTSTAHFVMDHLKDIHKVDIDLYHVEEGADIAESIIDACKKVLDKVWDSKKILEFASSLTPKLDVTESGFSFGLGTKGREYKKTLHIAFEFLEETIKRTNGKLVVLLDEFQAIKEVNSCNSILKYIRGKIQKIKRVSFMYVGSVRHEMDHIFRDQSSPFYKQAEIIYFKRIEEEVFFNFVAKKFKSKKIILSREVYHYLCKICYGITGDIQTFCRIAFDTLEKGTHLNFEAFFYILEKIYKNEQKYFKNILDEKGLTKVQKKLIIQLANAGQEGKVKFFGKDFQKVIGVKSPGAVTNAIAALEKKEFIYKSDDKYCFSNPFFKEWILDYRLMIRATAGNLTAGSPTVGTRLDFGYRQTLMAKNQAS